MSKWQGLRAIKRVEINPVRSNGRAYGVDYYLDCGHAVWRAGAFHDPSIRSIACNQSPCYVPARSMGNIP